MTTNRLILLLDIHRGYDESNHTGTLREDLVRLEKDGLILSGVNGPILSRKGQDVVEVVLGVASLV